MSQVANIVTGRQESWNWNQTATSVGMGTITGYNQTKSAINTNNSNNVVSISGNNENQRKDKPYKNSRPSYAEGQVETVWENAKIKGNGHVYDPSGAEIFWDQSKHRNGQWDMGHIPGKSYKETHRKYLNGTISKKEFLDWYQAPANYRPELPVSNRGHRYE